jgi:multiple sugar transport system permease protein
VTPASVAEELGPPSAPRVRPGRPARSGRFRPGSGRLVDFVDRHLPVLFPLPAVLLVVALMLYPLVYTLLLSTRSYDLTLRRFRVIGLSHYLAVLTSERFWDAFARTLAFTLLSVAASIVVGMVMALVLNRDFRGARWARTAFLLPMVATPVATSLVWMMMFNPTLGVLNYFLRVLGLPPSLWVADPRLAIPSIVLVDVWHFAPFAGLILLAGLRSLPVEPFESAMIDGASRVQTFLRITLPLLRPVLLVVLMFRTIDALKVFDLIWVMTAGGPGFASETLYVYAYNQAFKYLEIGYGSAVIVVFTLIVAAAALAWIRVRDQAWA